MKFSFHSSKYPLTTFEVLSNSKGLFSFLLIKYFPFLLFPIFIMLYSENLTYINFILEKFLMIFPFFIKKDPEQFSGPQTQHRSGTLWIFANCLWSESLAVDQ